MGWRFSRTPKALAGIVGLVWVGAWVLGGVWVSEAGGVVWVWFGVGVSGTRMASYCFATCSMAASGMSVRVSGAVWVGFVTPKGGGGSLWVLALVAVGAVIGAAIGFVVWAAVWVTVLVLWLIWLVLPWIWIPELAPGGLGVWVR